MNRPAKEGGVVLWGREGDRGRERAGRVSAAVCLTQCCVALLCFAVVGRGGWFALLGQATSEAVA